MNEARRASEKKLRDDRLALRKIVMWDGEGIQNGEDQEYAMLCNSEGAQLSARRHLTTLEIFTFLVENSDPKAINVGFALGYDIQMWLRSLSGEKGITMVTGRKRVTGKMLVSSILNNKSYGGISFFMGGYAWSVNWRPRKQFVLKRWGIAMPDGSIQRYADEATLGINLWDIWGFYQGKFTDALEKNNIACELEVTKEMKAKRGRFGYEDFDEVMRYCFSECRDGAVLFKRTILDCIAANIIPSRYDGPGALAASLFKREDVKAHIKDEPKEVEDPAKCAYFGGRIEALRIGRMQGVRGYDIASAYPAQIQNLPSLHGDWVLHDGAPSSAAREGIRRLYHVEYAYQRGLSFYPLPYRSIRDEVLFSAEGENWHWDVEMDGERVWCERFRQQRATVLEYWEFTPNNPETKPFAFVPTIFKLRSAWKNGTPKNPAEKILKLALNSLYGKMAQQLGAVIEEVEGVKFVRKPPYFSMVWAGIITAGARAELLKAACATKCDDSVVLFMTDGIYVRENLGISTMKEVLGAWEPAEEYDDFVVAQAGVYWYRKRGKAWEAKYRGFDKESMETPDIVLNAWKAGCESVEAKVHRFIGYGIGLMGEGLWEKRCTWTKATETRVLQLTGESAKRKGNPEILVRDHVPLEVQYNCDYEAKRRKGNGLSSPYKSKLPSLEDQLDTDQEEIEA